MENKKRGHILRWCRKSARFVCELIESACSLVRKVLWLVSYKRIIEWVCVLRMMIKTVNSCVYYVLWMIRLLEAVETNRKCTLGNRHRSHLYRIASISSNFPFFFVFFIMDWRLRIYERVWIGWRKFNSSYIVLWTLNKYNLTWIGMIW